MKCWVFSEDTRNIAVFMDVLDSNSIEHSPRKPDAKRGLYWVDIIIHDVAEMQRVAKALLASDAIGIA